MLNATLVYNAQYTKIPDRCDARYTHETVGQRGGVRALPPAVYKGVRLVSYTF